MQTNGLAVGHIHRYPSKQLCLYRSPLDGFVGASLKTDVVVRRENELGEILWTRNSRWPRHPHFRSNKGSWQYYV